MTVSIGPMGKDWSNKSRRNFDKWQKAINFFHINVRGTYLITLPICTLIKHGLYRKQLSKLAETMGYAVRVPRVWPCITRQAMEYVKETLVLKILKRISYPRDYRRLDNSPIPTKLLGGVEMHLRSPLSGALIQEAVEVLALNMRRL